MTITTQEAAAELLARRAARLDPIKFAEMVDVPGRPTNGAAGPRLEEDAEDGSTPVPMAAGELADHHKLILCEMDACANKPYGRLIIMAPPGSAKSTYASVVYPAYRMGMVRTRVALLSYDKTLARKMGRRTRSIVTQRRYVGITNGVGMSSESAAMDNFVLSNGSEYMAAGLDSGINGNRLDMVIIDDPVKGADEAKSPVMREKVWDAYQNDVKTRLVPGGSITIIQTRWHEDDLSGRILPTDWKGESGDILCKDNNVWRVLCLQAECATDTDPLGRKRGQMLWPQWFTAQHWDQFRPFARTWGSLYQQLPTPLDGDLFKPENLHIIDAVPAGYINWIRGWDLASVENGGDWTVGALLGQHGDGRVIVGDVVRKQLGPDKRDALMRGTAEDDGFATVQDVPQDPGQAGKTQIVAMGKLFKGYRMVFSGESGDKVTRAEPYATQVNTGNVYLLRADWNRAYREELRSFPNGSHDDQVDASSRAYARLLGIAGKMRISQSLLKRINK